MDTEDITEEFVRDFTDDDIVLSRGIDYFRRGMVKELVVEPDRIMAKVGGKDDLYQVTVRLGEEGIDADCTCPYKGFTCKHIVAVLHKLIDARHARVGVEVERVEEDGSEIDSALNEMTKEELIAIIKGYLDAHSELKRKILTK